MGLQLSSLIKQKKGFTDFISLFFALAVLFGVAIFAIILYNAYNDNIKDNLNDALTASTPVDENANITKVLDQTSGGIGKLNPLFPLLLVGLFGFVLVMALMAKSHPAFLFIGFIVLAVALILAVTYSNVYESIATTTNFSDTNDAFSVIGLIMGNLPIVIFILFIAIAIILYALPAKPQGGAY
jgi:hypothetical protein